MESYRAEETASSGFRWRNILVLWGYLLYRATTLAIGYITQNQPSNPLVDSGLMLVSVIGAMQTFARKTVYAR